MAIERRSTAVADAALATRIQLRENAPTIRTPWKDFYTAINARWLQDNPRPDNRARWTPVNATQEKVVRELETIVHQAEAAEGEVGTTTKLVRDFYTAGTNIEQRNRQGITPLEGIMQSIEGITHTRDVIGVVAALHQRGISAFFIPYVERDLQDNTRNVLYLHQGGLGMTDVADYQPDSEKRQPYRRYISEIFELAGLRRGAAAEAAASVVRVEDILAEGSKNRIDLREPTENYSPFTLDQATDQFGHIDWRSYFRELGATADINNFIVQQPEFMQTVDSLLHGEGVTVQDIKNYLTFCVLNATGDLLSNAFASTRFGFYGTEMQGLTERSSLETEVLEKMLSGIEPQGFGPTVNVALSPMTHAIGPLYVEAHFSEADKGKLTTVADHLKDSFIEMIDESSWMRDPETKEEAKNKLRRAKVQVGYPDRWMNLDDLAGEFDTDDSYVGKNITVSRFGMAQQLKELGASVDNDTWYMAATTVNAGTFQETLKLTFPAAFLQPPFYDAHEDIAYSFGSIGAIAAHELVHISVDKLAREFDSTGIMRDWQSFADKDRFDNQIQPQFVEFFGNQTVTIVGEQLNVDGRLTLDENIADVVGLQVAYKAFRNYLEAHPKDNVIQDGLTPDQRFFIGYGRLYAAHLTEEMARRRLRTSVASPAEIRVNGVVAHIDAFYEAFGITEDHPMYIAPEKRLKF